MLSTATPTVQMLRALATSAGVAAFGLIPGRVAAASELEDAVVREGNRVRADHDLGRLDEHTGLARCADRWSRHMAAMNILSHPGDLLRRLSAVAPRQRLFAENVAWMPERGPTTTARRTIRAWMRSPAHRDVLLTARLDLVGVGTARTGDHVYVTADFAGR